MRLLPVLLAVCFGLAAGAARTASVELRSDERLSRRITLNEPMTPVRRLLARISAECLLPLDAVPALRDEIVCLCVEDRPCGEVLDELAHALEHRWVPGTGKPGAPAYRLTEDPDVRPRRLSQARAYRREAGQELVHQLGLVERLTQKLGNADRTEVRDELERLETWVISLPTGPERLRAELEYKAAQESVDLELKPLLLALADLPPEARERLLDGERLVMAARRPGAIPMPEEVLKALRAARRAQGPEPTARISQTDDEAIDFLSRVAWGDLSLCVRARWLPGQPERLRFDVPTFVQTPSMAAYGPAPVDLRPGSVTADRPELLRTPVSFTWPGKKLQRDEPLTYYTGITVAEVLARLAAMNPRWQVSGGALLEGIQPPPAGAASQPGAAAEPAGVLLSRLGEKGRAGSLPLGELLEALAQRGGVDIRITREGWIRFQSTRPFRLQERQIDPRVLQEVFGSAVEEAGLTPEAAMRVGRSLSRAQLETLSGPYLGFPRHLTQNSGLRSAIDAWRMLDRFSAADRQALLGGTVLRFAGLDERGRTAVREYIRSVSDNPLGAPLDLELTPRDLPALQISLTPARGSTRTLELRAGKVEPPIYSARLEAEWNVHPMRNAGCGPPFGG